MNKYKMLVVFFRLAMFFLSMYALGAKANPLVPGVPDVHQYALKESGYYGGAGHYPGRAGSIFWIDDQRVLFVGGNANTIPTDGTVPEVWLPRLYLWNVARNAITANHMDAPKDAKDWSRELCVSGGRVWFQYWKVINESPRRTQGGIFAGPFGKEKLSEFMRPAIPATREQPVKTTEHPLFNHFTCTEYRPEEMPKLGDRVRPLLPGEYWIDRKDTAVQSQGHQLKKGFYRSQDGKETPLILGGEQVYVQRYFENRDVYVVEESASVISEKVVRRFGLLDRHGKLHDYTPPSGPWMNSTVYVAPTKRGMFIVSNAIGGHSIAGLRDRNGAGGGYLMIDGRLVRLIAGFIAAFDVSPNGCRIVLSHKDENQESRFTRVKVLDICLKGN